MSRLAKVAQKIFGSSAGTNQISKFGSLYSGSPAFTTDPAQAQSLANWLTGWLGAAIGGNAPAVEDMNAVHFVLSYQLAYLMQAGIPEWDNSTTYYIGSLAQDGAGQIYSSLFDGNINHSLSDPIYWKKIGGDVMTALGDIIFGDANGSMNKLPGNQTTKKQYLTQQGNGLASAAPVWRDLPTPTVQRFTAPGSGTYTTPDDVLYIRVRLVGGGGGGGGSGSTGTAGAGGNGGTTSFGTSLLTATGGSGGSGSGSTFPGGVGGTVTINAPASTVASIPGGQGQGAPVYGPIANGAGGSGGISPFGGAGQGAAQGQGAAVANTGSGGSGGGTNGTSSSPGAGGGAGGFIEAIIVNPAASYSYTVGAAGTAGTLGTSGYVGGAGGSGYIEITEYYQ